MNVADLRRDEQDAEGQTVDRIFAKKPPIYAVYRADDRVKLHFADARDASDKQRKDLSQLAPLRGEIDGLIDGWRPGHGGPAENQKMIDKAQRYQRRLGDALVVAMEEDLTGAREVLTKIKEDILGERVATARFEYLIAAFATAMAMMFVAWLLGSLLPLVGDEPGDQAQRMVKAGVVSVILIGAAILAVFRYSLLDLKWRVGVLTALIAVPIASILFLPPLDAGAVPASHSFGLAVCRAAAAGSIGAFFSISLAIRNRTVLPDLLRTSNLMDAILRVTIGFIAAVVLIGLVLGQMVKFSIGERPVTPDHLLAILLIGFIAGFSERFVPDLLDKASAKPNDSPVVLGNDKERKVGEIKQVIASADSTTAAALPKVEEPDLPPGQMNEDCCASDITLNDDEVTDDVDLPPASGGVAMPDAEKAS